MKILVVGATSAIAQATARRWAVRGESLYLAARRESLLATCAEDLRVRGAARVAFEAFDVLEAPGHEAMIERAAAALGGLDCALVAHGSLPDQSACEADPDAAARQIELNAVSTVVLALRLARRFESQGQGRLAVITSVAGVRGRRSNFVYGAAKAMVSTALEGLRHKLHGSGVAIVDIRPGFVDTPMTEHFPKGPLWAAPDRVARDIVAAVDAGRGVAYTPWFWRWIMLVIRHIPEPIFARMKL